MLLWPGSLRRHESPPRQQRRPSCPNCVRRGRAEAIHDGRSQRHALVQLPLFTARDPRSLSQMLRIPLAASELVCSFGGWFPEADGIPLGHHSLPLAHATEASSACVLGSLDSARGVNFPPQAGCTGGSLPIAQMDHTEVCPCSPSEHCWWERRALSVGGPTTCSGPCSWPGNALHTVSKVQSLMSWLKSPEKSFYLPP